MTAIFSAAFCAACCSGNTPSAFFNSTIDSRGRLQSQRTMGSRIILIHPDLPIPPGPGATHATIEKSQFKPGRKQPLHCCIDLTFRNQLLLNGFAQCSIGIAAYGIRPLPAEPMLTHARHPSKNDVRSPQKNHRSRRNRMSRNL